LAYIGVQPAEAYTSFAVQHFTTSATTSYTLDNAVANENEIALFINNVRQQPGSSYAYTASGTTLTLSAATSASDTMYCVFIGKAVQTVTPANGSVTNDMLSGSIANSKLANSSITLNGSAVSLGGSATVGGTNTPAFRVGRSSAQSIPTTTHTVIIFDSEQFDTDNAYDTSNGRFTVPVGEAGKYFFYSHHRYQHSGGVNNAIEFHKNGSQIVHIEFGNNGPYPSCQASYIGDLAEGDYIQVTAYQDNASNLDLTGNINYTSFGGFKLL
jgi:hypothetical protein